MASSRVQASQHVDTASLAKSGARPRSVAIEEAAPESLARTGQRLAVDERRAQLVALGIELFNRRPYDEISIDDIAEAAGISKGLLYHYFPSKKAFYVETVRAGATTMRTELEPHGEGSTPLEKLRLGVERYIDFVERHPRGFVHVLRSGVGFDPEVAKIVDRTRRAMVDQVLTEMMLPPTPAVVLAVHGWVGFVEVTSVRWLEKKTVPRATLIDLLSSSLIALVMGARSLPEAAAIEEAPEPKARKAKKTRSNPHDGA
ncbi:MAG: TetR/AcrR family transcriptional regulator [Polyangiales bacterium]